MATTNGASNGTSDSQANQAKNSAETESNQSSRRASRSRTNPAKSQPTENNLVKNNLAENSAVELEEKMSEVEKPTNGGANAAKAGKLELASKPTAPEATELAVHDSHELEVAESYSEAGIRPIEVSHLEVYGTILNNRPVSASHLQVIEYIDNRPIFASDITICDDLTLPGGRPIVASDSRLMEASLITGGRPIASNDIGDGEGLMGYLD